MTNYVIDSIQSIPTSKGVIMKLKSKMISTVLSMTLALGVMGFAVYAAATQTLTVNNTVNFVSNHVLASIVGDVQGVAVNSELVLDYSETVGSNSEEGYLQSKPWNIGDMRFFEETGTIEITITITNLSKERSFTFELLNNQYSAWNGEDLDGSNITRNVVYTTTNAAPVTNEEYTGGKVAVESEKEVEILITLEITNTGKSVDNFDNSFDIELQNVGANGEQPEEPEQPDAPLFQGDLEKPLLTIPEGKPLNEEDLPEMIVEDMPAYYGLYEDENYENKVTFPYTGGQTTLYPKFGEDRTDMVFELINNGTEYAVEQSLVPAHRTIEVLEIPETYRGRKITKVNTFSLYTLLNEISIPDTVTSINSFAFNNSAWYANQPDNSLLYINNIAYRFKGLVPENVTIKEGTRVITSSVFSSSNITSAHLPSTLKVIPTGALTSTNASNLVNITVAEGNPYFVSLDNVLYNVDQTRLIRIPVNLTSFTIPSQITHIESGALQQVSNLKYITFHENITRVDANALSGTRWQLDNNSGPLYIGKVFYSYRGTAPSSFAINEGTVSIAGNAFSSRTTLTSISIPYSVEHIGANAFVGCTGLTSIALPENLLEIENDVFRDCSNLTSINLPATLMKLGGSAFRNTKITNIELPIHIKHVEESTFENAPLTSIVLPEGLISIKPFAFQNTSLISVTLPSTLESIGSNSFSNIHTLKEVFIPNGLTMIEESAFNYNSNLETIFIPESVNVIAPLAFALTSKVNLVIIDSVSVVSQINTQNEQGHIASYTKMLYIRSDISNIGSYISENFTQTETTTFNGATYNVFVKK